MHTYIYIFTAFMISDLVSFLGHLHGSKAMQSLRSLCACGFAAWRAARACSCRSTLGQKDNSAGCSEDEDDDEDDDGVLLQTHRADPAAHPCCTCSAGPKEIRGYPKDLLWHAQNTLGSSVRVNISQKITRLTVMVSACLECRHMAVLHLPCSC